MKKLVMDNSNSDYYRRKEQRRRYYNDFMKGWKERPCGACAGSGYYDDNGSPKCESCNGTGKEKYKPTKSKEKL